MRQQVIDQIKALAPNTIGISTELPYDESGVELYVKNPKRIYVDSLDVATDPLFSTLGGDSFANEINIVRIYFTTDAKNPQFDYSELVSDLRRIKDSIQLKGATTREAVVQTRYAGDLLVTEIEYRLTRLN